MIYSKNSLETLRDLADPVEILSTIGGIPYYHIQDMGTEVRSPCPLHGGDHKTAFSWKKGDGIWTCFSKRCGEEDGVIRDLYGFVMLKKGVPFDEAARIVAGMYGFSLEQQDIDSFSELYIASKLKKDYSKVDKYIIDQLEELNELPGFVGNKDTYTFMMRYLYRRGYYDVELIKDFKLYPCVDSKGFLRLGIPTFDDNNRLVGVNSRRMDSILNYPATEPKYRLISGFKKGSVLFNLNRAKNYSRQKGIILVEGEFSTIRLCSYGINNVVCSMGTSLSDKQLALIYKYSYHLTFLVEEGQAALEGVYRSIRNIIPNAVSVSVAKLPSGDPDDNDKKTIVQVLENANKISINQIEKIKQGDFLL